MGSFKTRPLAPTIGGASRYELRFLLSVVHERSVLRRARGFLDSSITVISRVICSTQLRRLGGSSALEHFGGEGALEYV